MTLRSVVHTIIIISMLLVAASCGNVGHGSHKASDVVLDTVDLDEIVLKDTLIALIGYSSTSYFIYQGRAMGFEYELLKKFADHLGVELKIKIIKDLNTIFDELNRNNGDVVAHAMAITKNRTQMVLFTQPLNYAEQVLVQARPKNWWSYNQDVLDKGLVINVIDLIGKHVHVKRGSSYYDRLVNLCDELGDTIYIHALDGSLSTEDLIEQVSLGEIEYTVADENIAVVNQGYYNNIDIRTKISFPQRLAWAMRKSSPNLLLEFNTWLDGLKTTAYYNVLYNKYFKNRSINKMMFESDFSSHNGSFISKYDNIFKDEANKIGWDWRLLAAQSYHESRWDPMAESWMGAYGLMQLIPETANMYGFYDLFDPKENVEVGARHLEKLSQLFLDIDSAERIKFALASYNVGYGHVKDARFLAKKYGKNPNIWDNNVDSMLVLKSKKEYFLEPGVEHGYCRGIETYNYVRNVLAQYNHYTQFFN